MLCKYEAEELKDMRKEVKELVKKEVAYSDYAINNLEVIFMGRPLCAIHL